jgi:uncharacterized protein (DUF427 family)
MFNGQVIADSKRMRLLYETGHLPVYYFPQEDVRMEYLTKTDYHTHCPLKGDASYWTVKVGGRMAENAAWDYPQPLSDAADLKDYIAFDWGQMDAWFEEDEEIYVHARDPYKRVDALRSSRHVKVVVAGETVAESHRPLLLFETGLPTRYYIPKIDLRMDLLVTSDTRTRCPYKGVANYFSVKSGDTLVTDIAWYYPYPVPECPRIENLVCFYNERVDALYLDGELQPKPQTKWS